MPQLKNGMIVFMRDQLFPGPKLLDIEITNTFPLIALTNETHLVYSSQKTEILSGYDHIAIPPDFRLHISGSKDHIFFNAIPVWNFLEGNSTKPFHYFSIIGLPARINQVLVKPGENRKWHQAEIIYPFKDDKFNGSTRLFIDFFLHSIYTSQDFIYKAPLIMKGLRLATDQRGSVLGPYQFESIQRRKKPIINTMFSIRFGFANIDDNESIYIFTPLDIFQKRPRN